MSVAQTGFAGSRQLPAKPNLEFLKNEAKQRLRAHRVTAPDSKLADVQHQLAREYGFANWRDLKAKVERSTPRDLSPVAGDWIDAQPSGNRLAMHIRLDGPDVAVTVDACDFGFFDMVADDVVLEGDRLSFTLLTPLVEGFHQGAYQARWDIEADRWIGEWTAHGLTTPLNFVRGAYPAAPRFEGLDGFWDGRLDSGDRLVRLIFRLKTGPHGTFAWLDSPDTGLLGRPAVAISRRDREITITMKTVTITGTLSDDGQWVEGRFLKGESSRPLTLIHRPPGAAPPLPQRAPAVELPREALARLVGDYITELKTLARLTLEDGRLHVQFLGPVGQANASGAPLEAMRGPRLELLAASQTKFFWRVLDATAEFELGSDGRAVAMVTRQSGRRFRATRIG